MLALITIEERFWLETYCNKIKHKLSTSTVVIPQVKRLLTMPRVKDAKLFLVTTVELR